MIVRDDVGIVWRFFMGACLDAMLKGRLSEKDERVYAILNWMASPGDES